MIPETNPQSIKSLTYQADLLSVYFENDWYQENIRFSWENHYFVLNFDCYSQSCWLEGQGSKSTESLANLYSALEK